MPSDASEVKWLSPKDRFVIALRSPGSIAELRLCICPPEKNGPEFALLRILTNSLQSNSAAKFEEMRRISKISRATETKFSAMQTEWRRERDSNPRYGFPYIGFQDRLFQPLTHPSARDRAQLLALWVVYNSALDWSAGLYRAPGGFADAPANSPNARE